MYSVGNHTFGGKKPLMQSKSDAFARRRSAMPYSTLKSKEKPELMASPQKSIYQIVAQKIDMPEGLLYRGKYCGKSQLRKKVEEFGEEPKKLKMRRKSA